MKPNKTLREVEELVLKAFPSPEEVEKDFIKTRKEFNRATMVNGGKRIRVPLYYGKR